MELSDLFGNSPPPSPSRRPTRSRSESRSRSPGTPIREQHRNGNGESLFLSPGIDSPLPNAQTRTRISRSRARSRSISYDDGPTPIPIPISNGQQIQPQQRRQGGEHTNIGGGFELDSQDPFAALNNGGTGQVNDDEDDDEAGKKRKRVFAKIDADRLTSDKGLPALCRLAKKFKVKGKGHEAKDLNNLLDMYQMWAHGMFPKGDFKHTVNRVEHVCRSRRLESAIRGYRDAFYPRPPSPSPALDQDRTATGTRDTSPFSDAGVQVQADISPFISSEVGARTTNPLFAPRLNQVEQSADTDIDLEEMMALEEMEREEHARSQVPVSMQQKTNLISNPLDGPPELEEEDEWEGLYD